jgi:hypothetical protein
VSIGPGGLSGRCYGREDELAFLRGRIDGTRSVTLVIGDSGIGKSTLVDELRMRLAGPAVFVGAYEAQRGDGADPLVRCLASLLDRHVSGVEGWQGQVHAAVQRLWRNLKNPERLRNFFLGLTRAAGELPYVKEFGKAASEAITAVTHITGVGEGLPAEWTIRLPSEVFRDVTAILLDAFPGTRLVFIIDNLSADAEALTNEPGTLRTTDGLLSFLTTHLTRSSGLHFVMTWKDVDATAPVLEKLSGQIREYGGDVLRLAPLGDDAMAALLASEFPWFVKLSSADRSRVVRLTAGLPAVAQWWSSRGIAGFDVEGLRNLAREAISRKYQSLERALRQSLHPSLLYQLVTMPKIPPVTHLAQITGGSSEQVRAVLRSWTDMRLLRREGAAYRFDHETKQLVAYSAALTTLEADARLGAARDLVHFYLSHAGFAQADHPDAGKYVGWALSVARGAGFPSPELKAIFYAYLCLSDALDEVLGWPPVPDLAQILALPWNTRFLLFHAATARLPESASFVDSLHANVLDDPERLQSGPRNVAAGLWNAMHAYRRVGRLVESERLLQELRSLQRAQPKDAELAVWLARGLRGVLAGHGRAELDRVPVLLEEIAALQAMRADDPDLAAVLAGALFDAVTVFGHAGRLDDVDRLLDRLRSFSRANASVPAVTTELIKAIVNAMSAHGEAADLAVVDRLLADVRALARRHRAEPRIAEFHARGLTIALRAYRHGRRLDVVETLLEELRRLDQDTSGADDVAPVVAIAIREARAGYRSAGQDTERDALLDELRALSRRHPASGEVVVALAAELHENLGADLHAGRSAEVERGLQELRSIHREHVDRLDVATIVARAIVDVIPRLVGPAAADQLLEEIRALHERHRTDPELVRQHSYAIVNTLNVHQPASTAETVGPLLDELRTLRSDHPNVREIAQSLAWGLMVAVPVLGREQRVPEITIMLDELRALVDEERTLQITLVLGHAVVGALLAYERAGDLAEVERLVEELRSLAAAAPTVIEMVQILARGLSQAISTDRPQRAEAILDELRRLRSDHDDDQVVAEALAVALLNARPVYRAGGADRLRALRDEVRTLARAFPDSEGIRTIDAKLTAA